MSSDLPSQLLLQQHAARPVSGEELETFGKHAAAGFHAGKYNNLNDAVVETVKHAGLSPEQVRRVCEFTNTHAFLSEFKKTAEPHKYVHFDTGLANPAEILKDLNDGGGGTIFDRGLADYAHAPAVVKMSSVGGSLEKTASVSRGAEEDRILEDGFKTVGGPDYPYENPLSDTEDVQCKLAAARDAATAELSELEVLLLDAQSDLYNQVKQAALAEMPMGHVVQAWVQALAPEMEYMKFAWAHVGNRLVAEGVFEGFDALGASLEKTAGDHSLVNEDHPLISTFAGYCETLNKLAQVRAARDELIAQERTVGEFLRLGDQHLAGAGR